MIAAALQWLQDTIEQATETTQVDADRDLWNVKGRLVEGPLDPEVPRSGQHFNVSTLIGLAAYINEVDELPDGTVVIVPGIDYVQAFHTFGRLDVGRDKRRMLAVAKYPGTRVDRSITMPLREAILWLRSGCAPGGDREALIEMLSHVSVDENAVIKETGVGQTVTVRKGVDTVVEEKILPHYLIAPYRTFHEITQPMSPYSLRIDGPAGAYDSGPSVTLVCSDGDAWKTEATTLIADWMRAACPEEIVLG